MTRKDRNDAIAFFQEVAEREIGNAKYSKLAIEALKQSEQPEWTPVSERLPDDYEDTLTTIQSPNGKLAVRSGVYNNGLFINDNGITWKCTDKEIIAWMPLPEPYKADEEITDGY